MICSKLCILIKKNYAYLFIFSVMILDLVVFCPIKFVNNNQIVYHAFLNLGIHNFTVFSALMVGLFTSIVTIYTNNKNLEFVKFSVIPNSFRLKSDLELELSWYRRFDKMGIGDELSAFNKIFSLFIDDKSNFKLIAPESYNYIIFKLLIYKAKELDEGLPPNEEISVKIMRSLGKLTLMNDGDSFLVKNIEMFDEYWDSSKFDEDLNLKITNDNIKKLIDAITDDEIQKEVFNRYEEVIKLLKKFFNTLESEL
ncbi:hypothetical protein [uncultured Methanobrevibacter sp.]|uniref:hypothetical protein n=1 Tax=uncultured Methanobrevibacter sp. TaxID=253161 RepID=UPI0025FA44CA|nr:hypothetical protein [uncultured Methanobrevibacter sp.]